jgi:hypothetical protein
MLTCLLLSVALVVVALNQSIGHWEPAAVTVCSIAAMTLGLAAAAVYNVHGYFSHSVLRRTLSTSSLGVIFPFSQGSASAPLA